VFVTSHPNIGVSKKTRQQCKNGKYVFGMFLLVKCESVFECIIYRYQANRFTKSLTMS